MAYSNGFMIILPHDPKTSLKLKKKKHGQYTILPKMWDNWNSPTFLLGI